MRHDDSYYTASWTHDTTSNIASTPATSAKVTASGVKIKHAGKEAMVPPEMLEAFINMVNADGAEKLEGSSLWQKLRTWATLKAKPSNKG